MVDLCLEDWFVIDGLLLQQIDLPMYFWKMETVLSLPLHLICCILAQHNQWTEEGLFVFYPQLCITRGLLKESSSVYHINCLNPTSLKLVSTKHQKMYKQKLRTSVEWMCHNDKTKPGEALSYTLAKLSSWVSALLLLSSLHHAETPHLPIHIHMQKMKPVREGYELSVRQQTSSTFRYIQSYIF